MLLVFFARMVDDLVATVVASAADRGKALIGQTQPVAPRARFEVVPARPADAANWVDGSWEWNGQTWSWQGGHWASRRSTLERASLPSIPSSPSSPSSRRPGPAMLAAHSAAR